MTHTAYSFLTTYRKLSTSDRQIFLDHLCRLDQDAQRLRFSGAVSTAFIENYVGKALASPAVVYGSFVDGTLRGTGELQSVSDSARHDAEAAFAVERPYRGIGVGTELMRRIIISAQNRGIRTIYTICVAENTRMRQLAEKYKAKLRIEHNEVAASLTMPPVNPASLAAEWRSDVAGMISSALPR